MNVLDRLIASVAPERALRRARARRTLGVLAHYDAATTGRRSKSWVPNPADADGAAARRARMAYISRDMVRNTPFALRAQQVITNNVVGDGIIPKVVSADQTLRGEALAIVEQHLDTTAIDKDGRSNLYGLQRLIQNAVVDAGEVLVLRHKGGSGTAVPFQIQVIEADYLDESNDGATPNGNEIREGIEFDPSGRRVAYYLYDQHPGSRHFRGFGRRAGSRRVDASEVLHIYRQDRPGQQRGVSWFAPVALSLQDLGDHQDAKLLQQKIAACFAAFRFSPDGDVADDEDDFPNTMKPGAILDLGAGEDVRFANPPAVQGFDEFTRVVLRSVAAGMGITYEALVGDLSNVNFSSARMGRMEMDRNVSSWQWLMMIPQFCVPFGEWMREALAPRFMGGVQFSWVPPHRILVDPTKEIPALRNAVRAGFTSRPQVIRELGFDPERVTQDMAEDAALIDRLNLVFDTDPRKTSAAGGTQARTPGSELPDVSGEGSGDE